MKVLESPHLISSTSKDLQPTKFTTADCVIQTSFNWENSPPSEEAEVVHWNKPLRLGWNRLLSPSQWQWCCRPDSSFLLPNKEDGMFKPPTPSTWPSWTTATTRSQDDEDEDDEDIYEERKRETKYSQPQRRQENWALPTSKVCPAVVYVYDQVKPRSIRVNDRLDSIDTLTSEEDNVVSPRKPNLLARSISAPSRPPRVTRSASQAVAPLVLQRRADTVGSEVSRHRRWRVSLNPHSLRSIYSDSPLEESLFPNFDDDLENESKTRTQNSQASPWMDDWVHGKTATAPIPLSVSIPNTVETPHEGDGDKEEAMEQRVRDLHHGGTVVYAGWVRSEQSWSTSPVYLTVLDTCPLLYLTRSPEDDPTPISMAGKLRVQLNQGAIVVRDDDKVHASFRPLPRHGKDCSYDESLHLLFALDCWVQRHYKQPMIPLPTPPTQRWMTW